jgi:c-di-GMP-binding flagellar brake protein YcgR
MEKKERRRSNRIPFEHTVSVKYKDKEFKTNTLNLSGHGLLILSPLNIKPKEELKLKISIQGKPIHIKAQSVWCSKREGNIYKLGLSFTHMSHEDRKIYVNYICENILNFYIDEEGNIRGS